MIRLFLLLVAILLTPSLTLAASTLRTGEQVSIASDQVVESNFYGLGEDIVVSGEVTGDLLGAAMNTNLNGKVDADVLLFSGEADLGGLVGGDVRVVAGKVTISGEVKGDLVVVAESLKILSTAKISGDAIVFVTEFDISGSLEGNLFGVSDRTRIDGIISGDVDIKTNEISLGERTDIVGVLKYTSSQELIRAQSAKVGGKIVRNDLVIDDKAAFKNFLIVILVLLFAVLVVFLFLRRFLEGVTNYGTKHTLRSLLLGFGFVFLLPIAVIILLSSTLGILIGFLLIFVYLSLIFFSLIASSVLTGVFLLKFAQQSDKISIITVVLGTLVTVSLSLIPVVGPVILLALLLTTFGAVSTHLYRLIRYT